MPTKNRITVVENVYHQVLSRQEQPTQYGPKPFTVDLETDEQVCQRRSTITEEWSEIDLGWVKQAKMLVIWNDEGRFPNVIPSPVDVALASKRVLEIALVPLYPSKIDQDSPRIALEAFGLVYPQSSIRLFPSDSKRLQVRCQSGTCNLLIAAFPE